jgi:hypothetical protein
MEMNGNILSTVDDSLPEIFQVICCLWHDISKPTASSDTDTTLSLALKQFDAQNDKKLYLRFMAFRIENGKI